MCADAVHTLYLREFKDNYPQAKLVGVQAMLNKDTVTGLSFEGGVCRIVQLKDVAYRFYAQHMVQKMM